MLYMQLMKHYRQCGNNSYLDSILDHLNKDSCIDFCNEICWDTFNTAFLSSYRHCRSTTLQTTCHLHKFFLISQSSMATLSEFHAFFFFLQKLTSCLVFSCVMSCLGVSHKCCCSVCCPSLSSL